MTTVKDIYNYIDNAAPFSTQEEWDNAGLLVGCADDCVTKAVMALDVAKDVVSLAAEAGAQLIISHHPIIFNPVKRLMKSSALYKCAQYGISVISAHTNFDLAPLGINTNLCKRLSLKNVKPIDGTFIVTGELDKEMQASDFARFAAETLQVSGLRYTDSEKPIRTVAIGGGACEEYLPQAMQLADCFLTGDMKYHVMLEAAEEGFCVISAGHYETESESFLMLRDQISKAFPDVEFIRGNQKNPVMAVL